MLVEIGSVAKGTVAKIVPYGAIVRLEGGQTGLVHISEITDAFVNQISDYFNEGDPILVKVIGVSDKGKYELSVKKVSAEEYTRQGLPPPAKPESGAAKPEEKSTRRREAVREPSADFEKKLSHFLKESEERLGDLKTAAATRRSRRKSKKPTSSSGSS